MATRANFGSALIFYRASHYEVDSCSHGRALLTGENKEIENKETN
jgi:hypothetical protein